MNNDPEDFGSQTNRERPLIGLARLVFIVVIGPVAVWWIINNLPSRAGNSPPTPGSTNTVQATLPPNAVEITLVSANTKEDWIEAVTASFNDQQFKTTSGKSIVVRVSHGNSGGSQADILSGEVQPTMWSPGDQSWIDGANDEWRLLHNETLITGACAPTVYAPIGFGMWRPMAEALGWPDDPISWETLVALAADPQGWGRYGHPEWGQFKFGHTHPDYSNSGMLMLTALAYDTLGITTGLTPELVKSEPVVAAMRDVELHTFHYGRQSRNLATLMAQRGADYLQAINVTEAELLRINREYADQMQFPLVFIFPANGAFWTEQPLCILDGDWVTAEQQEAARLYRDYLLAPEQQTLAVDHFLRPVMTGIPLREPFSLENGTDPSITPDTVVALSSPSAAAAEAVQDVFHQTKKKATVIVVLDTSGSMRGEKIKNATAATASFVMRLEQDDEVLVYAFEDDISLLQQSGSAGEVKEELAETITNLFAGGDTRLYDAVCMAVEQADAFRALNQGAGEQRLYGVVVLSDGQDTKSRITESDMFNCLPTGEDVDGIKVFTIAYGNDADHTVLQKIANKTNGRMFDGGPDTIEDVYVSISAEQ